MPQEDRLKKQIDEFGRVLGKLLAKLLGIKDTAEVDETIAEINDLLVKELGFDTTQLLSMPVDEFLPALLSKNPDPQNLGLMADILFHLSGYEEAEAEKELLRRCLKLYEYLNQGSVYSLDWHFKSEIIRQRLEE